MDEAPIPDGPVVAVNGAGLLVAIALLVAGCGLAMQTFLAGLGGAAAGPGAGSAELPSPAPPAPPSAVASLDLTAGYAGVGTLQPDQQSSFLESVRLSGTGGWSSRTEIVGYGVTACRLLAQGLRPQTVVDTLVADGEDRAQAEAVVPAAAGTLCAA